MVWKISYGYCYGNIQYLNWWVIFSIKNKYCSPLWNQNLTNKCMALIKPSAEKYSVYQNNTPGVFVKGSLNDWKSVSCMSVVLQKIANGKLVTESRKQTSLKLQSCNFFSLRLLVYTVLFFSIFKTYGGFVCFSWIESSRYKKQKAWRKSLGLIKRVNNNPVIL